MSYTEYYDLFDRCQDTAPYHLFVFDLVGSKKIYLQENYIYLSKLVLLIDTLYKKIEDIEKVQNRQILHRSPFLYRPTLIESEEEKGHFYFIKDNLPKEKYCIERQDLSEPFRILGDMIGLTILRDTLKEEEVYALFDQTKEELNIPYDFHYANGFYETDDYGEGATKLFRGYAIHMLGTQHKKENKIKKRS